MYLDAATADIPAEKLRDYLLSQVHPVGRYKSVVFRSLGYSADQWPLLERDLRSMLVAEATALEVTEHGPKYAVRGAVTGPNGRKMAVLSVWIILLGEAAPRFVTAYPGD
jgi:hypothetical protein